MSTTEIKHCDFFRKDLNLDDNSVKIFTEILYESMESSAERITTKYKSEIQSDLQKLEIQFRTAIKETKTDRIKWFFAFFVTLVIMILVLYATILLK
jgi:hypothetical protein